MASPRGTHEPGSSPGGKAPAVGGEPHLQELEELNPQLRWLSDGRSSLVSVSSNWSAITGQPIRDALGHGWLAFIHLDDLARYTAVAAQAFRDRSRFDIRLRGRVADGSYRWFRTRGFLKLDGEGKVLCGFGFTEDVHDQVTAEEALREREEHYRCTVELNPQIPWTADPQGRVLEVSPRWTQLTGQSVADTLEHGWWDFIHPDDLSAVASALKHGFETGTPQEARFRVKTASGSYRWMRVRAAPRRDESGHIIRWYGTTEDIDEQVTAELALRESEENYRYTIELSPQIPWAADVEGKLLEVGSGWFEQLGVARETMLNDGWLAILHPDDVAPTSLAWSSALRTGASYDVRYRLKMKDGSYSWFRVRAAPRHDARGHIVRWYGLAENIQEQVTAEQRLREREHALLKSQEQSDLLAKATNDLLWDWDLKTDHLSSNEALEKRFGYAQSQLGTTGSWWKQHIHPDDQEQVLEQLEAVLRAGDHYAGEYRFCRADGSYACVYDRGYLVRGRDGEPLRMVGAMQDLSERKAVEEQLRWTASHDALTSLPNRRLFQERLDEAIRSGASAGTKVGLLEIDIDRFKEVNDTLGHEAGDMLLRTFAERLRASVRMRDTVARLGGDELAVVLPDLSADQELQTIVDQVLAATREPFVYAGRTLDCRASIGASIYPQHGTTAEELLQNADVALYMAKASGRGGLTLFRSEHRHEIQQRTSMLNIARDLVAERRIVPHYQPKVELATGRIIGFEALLRWQHAHFGLQSPATISAAFDDHELAVAISDRMIESVITDMRRWLDRGVSFGHVAVNTAAAEFRHDDFAERVLERLCRSGIACEHFQLEVTESVFLGRGGEHVERTLRLLSDEGINIALDDFGTGFASLRHLKEFPVDIIKIDQSFVRGMADDESDAAIVRTVVDLSNSLGIGVVAEGIESESQAVALRALGCRYGQGYLYARAVPAASLPEMLALERSRRGASPS